jgi:hypothetical protein
LGKNGFIVMQGFSGESPKQKQRAQLQSRLSIS